MMTKVERLLLASQFRIHALLDTSERDYFERRAEALEHGFAAEYEDDGGVLEGIHDELSADDCREVTAILDMYRALQNCFDGLDDPAPVRRQDVEFPGFDGNAGDGRLGYFRYLRRDERFEDLRTWSDDCNSHADLMPLYRRQRERWRTAQNRYDLTMDELRAIIAKEDRAQGADAS